MYIFSPARRIYIRRYDDGDVQAETRLYSVRAARDPVGIKRISRIEKP